MIRGTYLLVILFGANAWSFPENVRHGYFNCTACHVSPSGGGVLNPYGRGFSAEKMSTWGKVNSSGFLFSNPEEESKVPWFRAQAFLKGIQIYKNTPTAESARTIPMQADIEVGADTEKFAIVATFGYRAKDASKELKEFFSRRDYALFRFSETVSARVGKFMHSFGLNGPDHITATRRGLGWDQNSESNNLEINYLGEIHSHTFTAIAKNTEDRSLAKENGASLNSSYFWKDNSRIGLSVYNGRDNNSSRWVYGPYGTITLTENLYLNSELFFQDKKVGSPSEVQRGYATFTRLGYEITKGFVQFAQFDRSNLNYSDQTQLVDIYGVGAQWLPYPHFDLLGFVGKEKLSGQEPSDYAWLMLSIYL